MEVSSHRYTAGKDTSAPVGFEDGWDTEPTWKHARKENILPLSGIDSRFLVVHPVA
jgi:hypothetical protein